MNGPRTAIGGGSTCSGLKTRAACSAGEVRGGCCGAEGDEGESCTVSVSILHTELSGRSRTVSTMTRDRVDCAGGQER